MQVMAKKAAPTTMRRTELFMRGGPDFPSIDCARGNAAHLAQINLDPRANDGPRDVAPRRAARNWPAEHALTLALDENSLATQRAAARGAGTRRPADHHQDAVSQGHLAAESAPRFCANS